MEQNSKIFTLALALHGVPALSEGTVSFSSAQVKESWLSLSHQPQGLTTLPAVLTAERNSSSAQIPLLPFLSWVTSKLGGPVSPPL